MAVAFRSAVAAVAAVAAAGGLQSPAAGCGWKYNLTGLQIMGDDKMVKANSTPAECDGLCCAAKWCTAWNLQLSSTVVGHHPRECWLSTSAAPKVAVAPSTDQWVGGARARPLPPADPRTTGAVIQPLSSWWWYKNTAAADSALLRELTAQSVAALRRRAANMSQLHNPASWAARRGQVGHEFSKLFAPLPPSDRQPPTYKTVSTLTRPGYTCNKILYETRPGFWVPAALWIPAGLRQGERRPGVLLTSGHTPDGFRSNNLFGPQIRNAPGDDDYEVVQINLVLRGFVVLAFDPIGQGERMQYADIPDGRPDPSAPWSKGGPGSWLWSSTSEHEFMGRQLLLNGVGLMSFWLHDEMISLDLLAAHPAVNPDALGVVGCSGGGTQSSYLAAMDTRIKAASMACYMSTFEIDRLWAAGGGSDGEQTWPQAIARGLDKPDLLIARANASTQVLITTADTCFPAAGGFAAVAEAMPAYKALGGKLDTFTAVWHHGWVLPTRQQISRFFCDELTAGFTNGNMPPACLNDTEMDVSALSVHSEWDDTDLKVTTTGQVVTAPECGASATTPAVTVHNFSAALTQQHMDALAERRSRTAVPDFLAHVADVAVQRSGYITLSSLRPPRFLGAQFASPHPPGGPHPSQPPLYSTGNIGLVERWMIFGEGECFAVVTLFLPSPVEDMMRPREPMDAIVLYGRTASDLASGVPADITEYVNAGFIVAAAEVCGTGSTGDAFDDTLTHYGQAAEDLAQELNRSVVGFMAGDMVRVHKFLRARQDIRQIQMAVATDLLDVALIHAILADSSVAPTHIAISAPRSTLSSAAAARVYKPHGYFSWIFGMLQAYDLPDIVAAAARICDVLIAGPLNGATLDPLTRADAQSDYAYALEAVPGKITVREGAFSATELANLTLHWLR